VGSVLEITGVCSEEYIYFGVGRLAKNTSLPLKLEIFPDNLLQFSSI